MSENLDNIYSVSLINNLFYAHSRSYIIFLIISAILWKWMLHWSISSCLILMSCMKALRINFKDSKILNDLSDDLLHHTFHHLATFPICSSTTIQNSLRWLHKVVLKFNYYHYVRIKNAYILRNVTFLILCVYMRVSQTIYDTRYIVH